MSTEDFDSIVTAARTGAEWALAILYRDIHPRLLHYLLAQEPDAAEDIASEVWLDVASGLVGFEGPEDGFWAWLFTIARRRLIDHRRRAIHRRTILFRPEELPAHGGTGNVEDEALANLGVESALARIAGLPPDQAEVVLLRVVADLPVDRVAAILGKRPGAVRALQHRALRQLARTVSREAVTE